MSDPQEYFRYRCSLRLRALVATRDANGRFIRVDNSHVESTTYPSTECDLNPPADVHTNSDVDGTTLINNDDLVLHSSRSSSPGSSDASSTTYIADSSGPFLSSRASGSSHEERFDGRQVFMTSPLSKVVQQKTGSQIGLDSISYPQLHAKKSLNLDSKMGTTLCPNSMAPLLDMASHPGTPSLSDADSLHPIPTPTVLQSPKIMQSLAMGHHAIVGRKSGVADYLAIPMLVLIVLIFLTPCCTMTGLCGSAA